MLNSLKLTYHISRNLLLDHRPYLLYLKPTARCNLRCKSCDRWLQDSSKQEELTLEEIEGILQKFRRAGCVVLVLWGGEPTLRDDLPEILAAAKTLGMRTSMCTNCLLLPRISDAVLPGLDVLLCSLDGHGAAHDSFRGVDGLFDAVVESIQLAAAAPTRCDIKIWSSVHRKNLDQARDMARLGQELGVGIEYFPVSRIAGYNDELVPDADELREVFSEILSLKKQGYPVRNPGRALKMMRDSAPFSCNFGRIGIFLDHRGNVYSCEDSSGTPRHDWCGHEDFDPDQMFRSREFRQVAEGLRQCNLCRLPCVMELAGNLPRNLASMFFSRKRW